MPARPRAPQLLSLGLFFSLCPSWLEDRDHQHVARVARSPGTGRAALCKKSLWVGKLLSWLETMLRGCCCKHKGNPQKESPGEREGALPALSWLGLLGPGQLWGCGGSPPLLGWGCSQLGELGLWPCSRQVLPDRAVPKLVPPPSSARTVLFGEAWAL